MFGLEHFSLDGNKGLELGLVNFLFEITTFRAKSDLSLENSDLKLEH